MHVALDNAGHFTSEHIFENLKDPFEFTFLYLEFGSFIFDLFFWLYSLFILFQFFPLPLSLSSRYSVYINREFFLSMNHYYFNFFLKLSKIS
jgi:hypothetical protein